MNKSQIIAKVIDKLALLSPKDKNKLDTMNYQVSTKEDSYYLQDGLNSLKKFSEKEGVNFDKLCKELLAKGSFEFKPNQEIVMI